MGRKWAVAIAAVVLAVSVARPAAGVLYDLMGHWAGAVVTALESRGIVGGDTRGNFNPDQPLSRAEMAKIITAGLGNGDSAALLARYPSRFRDIPDAHWAKGYVEALAEAGVTEGYGAGVFGPDDTVNRAQMAVFLVRAAGLAEEARLSNFRILTYRDDREIPDWARGSVHVALKYGFMIGFGDNTFRPTAPITRAEGSVALLRLMAYRGDAFHTTGTLVQIAPFERRAVIRTEQGQERTITLALDAQVYRGGHRVTAHQLEALDQVWVIFSGEGEAVFIEARYAELLGTDLQAQGRNLTLTATNGVRRTLGVQSGALIFVNGRPATVADLSGASEAYLSLDSVNGEARVIDALKDLEAVEYVGYDPEKALLVYVVDQRAEVMPVRQDIILLREGSRIAFTDLKPGDRIRIVRDSDGQVTYLQAER